jgi:hypothetical protein
VDIDVIWKSNQLRLRQFLRKKVSLCILGRMMEANSPLSPMFVFYENVFGHEHRMSAAADKCRGGDFGDRSCLPEPGYGGDIWSRLCNWFHRLLRAAAFYSWYRSVLRRDEE